jgi:putative transposase
MKTLAGELKDMSDIKLRKGRISIAGHVYLLTTVTYNRGKLFRKLEPARILVWEMRRLHEAGFVSSYAWVIMPDHLHWLLQLREDHTLPEVVKMLKARSALLINRSQNSQGHIWQKGYHEHALRDEENLTDAARYIITNPVRSGLVADERDYPHWDATWLWD